MASTAEIKCINKDPRQDPFHAIVNVGGFQGTQWKLSLADAVGKTERGEWRFYVTQAGKQVWVEVAISRAGNKYLKTQADGAEPNNLLSLPECP